MAIWHVKFSLVPGKGMLAVHGMIPSYIRDYQPPSDGPLVGADQNSANYWKSGGLDPRAVPGISKLLPVSSSWSSEAEMYGTEDGDRVEVWEDDVNFALDMRSLCSRLLESILAAAKQADCKIVMHGTGEVLDPDMAVVISKIRESGAYEFCADPEQYFRKRQGN